MSINRDSTTNRYSPFTIPPLLFPPPPLPQFPQFPPIAPSHFPHFLPHSLPYSLLLPLLLLPPLPPHFS
jgi:hypothetical protein